MLPWTIWPRPFPRPDHTGLEMLLYTKQPTRVGVEGVVFWGETSGHRPRESRPPPFQHQNSIGTWPGGVSVENVLPWDQVVQAFFWVRRLCFGCVCVCRFVSVCVSLLSFCFVLFSTENGCYCSLSLSSDGLSGHFLHFLVVFVLFLTQSTRKK